MDRLVSQLTGLSTMIKNGDFAPCIAYVNDKPEEYEAFELTMYESGDDRLVNIASISEVLERFYGEKQQ